MITSRSTLFHSQLHFEPLYTVILKLDDLFSGQLSHFVKFCHRLFEIFQECLTGIVVALLGSGLKFFGYADDLVLRVVVGFKHLVGKIDVSAKLLMNVQQSTCVAGLERGGRISETGVLLGPFFDADLFDGLQSAGNSTNGLAGDFCYELFVMIVDEIIPEFVGFVGLSGVFLFNFRPWLPGGQSSAPSGN